MSEGRIKVRANKSTGELEIEGSPQQVSEWWDKLWPQLSAAPSGSASGPQTNQVLRSVHSNPSLPDVFGEFFNSHRSDISDVDKVLVAAAFVQSKSSERTFSTKAANQLLMEQNIKVANASECVRRLTQSKRAFVVADGMFRVSAGGFDHLNSLIEQQ